MELPPELDRLATRWRGHPVGVGFAPLAEGLRKQGDLETALRIARQGTAQATGYLPGFLVLARIQRDRRDLFGAAEALRTAMEIDPADPCLLDAMADLAEAQRRPADAEAYRVARDAATGREAPPPAEPAESAPPLPEGPEVPMAALLVDAGEGAGPVGLPAFEEDASEEVTELVTESLAELYYRQGHRDRAIAVYRSLVERSPDNASLAQRLAGLEAEVRARRPRPYDARESGGSSVGDWLGAIASAAPAPRPRGDGLDAFFEAPAPRPDDTADLAAFQEWLKGLGT